MSSKTDAAPESPSAGGGRGRHVPKPWGHELVWTQTDRYVGKVIVIQPGQRLSLQYHERKDESVFVMQGTLRLHLADTPGPGAEVDVHDLRPGEYRRVPVGHVHRFEALDEEVRVLEVSTPELDDVVRLEDDYAREGTSEP